MPEPEAAVAIVHARQPEEAVLLMRRAERHEDSWSGQWSLPGGRCELRDVDLLHTALRELEEECGVCLRAGDMESAMPPRLARRAAGPYLLVAPFVFRADQHLATVLDIGEAAEAAWVPLALLRNRARHCLQPVPGRPPEMRFPAVAFSGTPLWGFTYRLLTDWLGMLPPPGEGLEQAGFAAANAILEFLLARGSALRQNWVDRGTRKEAILQGPFPAADVVEQFCRPGLYIDSVNRLEVRTDTIRVVGAAFEEYLLRATKS